MIYATEKYLRVGHNFSSFNKASRQNLPASFQTTINQKSINGY